MKMFGLQKNIGLQIIANVYRFPCGNSRYDL